MSGLGGMTWRVGSHSITLQEKAPVHTAISPPIAGNGSYPTSLKFSNLRPLKSGPFPTGVSMIGDELGAANSAVGVGVGDGIVFGIGGG